MLPRLRRCAKQAGTFSQFMDLLRESSHVPPLYFDDATCGEILQRLDLPRQYPQPSQLSIIDYHPGYSPFTYLLQKQLKPKHHVIFSETMQSKKFWAGMMAKDPDCKHMVFDGGTQMRILKHSFLNPALKSGVLEPQEQTDLAKVNPTVMINGYFFNTNGPQALRKLLFFNQMNTSVFGYNNVKMLAWMATDESLKYIAPLGSRSRRTNTMMANLFSDIKVIAYSNADDKSSIRRVYEHYPEAMVIPRIGDKDICLVEFQSNALKYDIKHPSELQLLIHKLTVSPSNNVLENLYVLGPGAKEYLEQKIDKTILDKKMTYVTEQDYIDMSDAYYDWPFKPNTDLEMFLVTTVPEES